MDIAQDEHGDGTTHNEGASSHKQRPYDASPERSYSSTSNRHPNNNSNDTARQQTLDSSDPRDTAASPQEQETKREDPDNVLFVGREKDRSQKRRPSGQTRLCGKCGQQLMGQFVRALGDTYHLECFTCKVRFSPFVLNPTSILTCAGLRQDSGLQILSGSRPRTRPIPSLRDRLLSTARPSLLHLRRRVARIIYYSS